MMSAKPRLVVPYGLKTLLEGLSRAVLKIQPGNIAQFASIYFVELLQFRNANPTLDIKHLVKEFHPGQVDVWPESESRDVFDSTKMSPQFTDKVLQDAGVFSPMQERQDDRYLSRQEAFSERIDDYEVNVKRMSSHVIDTQSPSCPQAISNPIINSQGSGTLYHEVSPVPIGSPEQEDVARKESICQHHQEQMAPGMAVSQEPMRTASYSFNDPENLERVSSITNHAPTERVDTIQSNTSLPHPDVDRMVPITQEETTDNPERADRVVSNIAQIPPGASESVEQDIPQVSTDPIPEKPDRIISKTMTTVISDKKSEGVIPADRVLSKTLQTESIPEKAERIVSKTSHTPSNQVDERYVDAVTYPDAATPLPPAPRTAASATKQMMDPKLYHEMATTVPPTRAQSQFKEISGATEGPQRVYKVPSTPYYDLHLAVERTVDGNHREPAYVPATEATMARIVRALSDIHTTIGPKLVQVQQPSYYDAPVDMRSSNRFMERANVASIQFRPQGTHYEFGSLQQGGTVPCYIEQIPKEILVPSQKGKDQPFESAQQPAYASQYPYQTAQIPLTQQPVYKTTGTGNYHASYQQEASNPQQANEQSFTDDARYYRTPEPYEKRAEAMQKSSADDSQNYFKDQGERDQANLWTLYRLTDLCHEKGYLAPPELSGASFNPKVTERSAPRNPEQLDYQLYAQQMKPPVQSQRSNYLTPQAAPSGGQPMMVNSPAYVLSDEEAKRIETPPFILVGSNVQDAHNWKSIPGHAVWEQPH
ncbi:calcium-binding tyrosine phosphorylation-regulated protein [Ascaphus truei]|uniref:calcium-binding tyrosine phosphorylation-regulated protein n=1 Tax=Ascaphus truei TaxID=8439 RepID=UPI003F5A8AD3